MNAKEVRENVSTYFPIFKWVWGGAIALIVTFATVVYQMKIETIELRKELEAEQRLNKEQERKIQETYDVLHGIARDQATLVQKLEHISYTVTDGINRVAKDTAQIRERVDRHIESGK